ncbi:MAG: acyltransferase [Gemmataceae bacterium]|nr:acyltransferase [Gemmataceae bacterium]
MASLFRTLATSDHPAARLARGARRWVATVSVPAPKVVVVPLVKAFLAARAVWHFGLRVFVCEPFLKAHCSKYGRGLRTDVYLHWIRGRGDLVLGDDVLLDGKCSITFAARFVDRPRLEVGDGTGIGHGCAFTVGKLIRIGRNCRIASDVWVFDSHGHPTDPERRRAGLPPDERDVHPVEIGDNVWIGRRAVIFPGVTVGPGSVVSAGAVVTNDVPPDTVVAGNPARRVANVTATPPPVYTPAPR